MSANASDIIMHCDISSAKQMTGTTVAAAAAAAAVASVGVFAFCASSRLVCRFSRSSQHDPQ